MTLEALKEAARLQGYAVFDYSKSRTMLIILGLYDIAKASTGGIVRIDQNNNKWIFIDDSLSEEKQLIVLAHELGHIVLNHVNREIDEKQKEIEADQFVTAVTGLKSFIER